MKILKYLFVLIISIYSSSFTMLKHILCHKGSFETETVCCDLVTKSSVYQMLICIGITLTPGTIVSKKEGDRIEVFKIKDGKDAPHLVFDRIFERGDSK